MPVGGLLSPRFDRDVRFARNFTDVRNEECSDEAIPLTMDGGPQTADGERGRKLHPHATLYHVSLGTGASLARTGWRGLICHTCDDEKGMFPAYGSSFHKGVGILIN